MLTITFCSLKTGSGKSTSAFRLAQSLAIGNKKIVLVDLDPAGDITKLLEESPSDEMEIDRLNRNPRYIEKIVHKTEKNVSIIKANNKLHSKSIDSINGHIVQYSDFMTIKNSLSTIAARFDYCIIDTAPTLDLYFIQGVLASDLLILPTTPDFFSIDHLQSCLRSILHSLPPGHPLPQYRILILQYDHGSKLARTMRAKIQRTFHGNVFQTPIPRVQDLHHIASTLFESGDDSDDLAPVNVPVSTYENILERSTYAFINLTQEIFNHEKTQTR